MGESSGSPAAASEEGELSNDSDDLSHLFVIDNTPADSKHKIDVPVYDKKFCDVLQAESKDKKDEKPKRPKASNTCWNCGGDHNLSECTQRRNFEAISRNRQIFMSKQIPRGSKPSRYHLDNEQKYQNFQPGKISNRLRRALGLQSNQLPRHIYRMRVLGYPPGWVEDARVCHSGLTLFDSNGCEVADPGFEDGEIVADGAKDKYDIKKIKEFPGFNCPHDSDIIDETELLNSKPMSEKDSIQRMVAVWQPKAVKAYKRKKMKTTSTSSHNTSDKRSSLLLLDDMEMDSSDSTNSDEDGQVDDVEGGEVPEGPSAKITKLKVVTKRCSSPSLDSPYPKKQRIGDEGDDGSRSSQNSEPSQKDINSPAGGRKTDSSSMPVTPDVTKVTLATPNVGKVTSVSLGTPVIVTSPFTCLPSPDKFAKNICDVINFENLPDSTGKYEKMSGLIQKVRNFVSKLNAEDDED